MGALAAPPCSGAFAYGKIQGESASSFWLIADAVKEFFDRHRCLPVPGSVPDMKAQSKVYVQLQNIYKTKARKDVAEVLEIVRAAPGGGDVDPEGVELFCKNAAFIKLINAVGASTDRLPAVVRKYLDPISTKWTLAQDLV